MFRNNPRAQSTVIYRLSLEVKYMACTISKGLAYIITLYTKTLLMEGHLKLRLQSLKKLPVRGVDDYLLFCF